MENIAQNSLLISELLDGNVSESEFVDDNEGKTFTHMEFYTEDDTFDDLPGTTDVFEDQADPIPTPDAPVPVPAASVPAPAHSPAAPVRLTPAPAAIASAPKNQGVRMLAASLAWQKRSAWKRKRSGTVSDDMRPRVLEPQQYFSKYIGKDLFELGAINTNKYYMQSNGMPLNPPTTAEEIKAFFGIMCCNGCIQVPAHTSLLVRNVWTKGDYKLHVKKPIFYYQK